MSKRAPSRRHSFQFKAQVCSDIRSGKYGRRETERLYHLSSALIQIWLRQYDLGELDAEEVTVAVCEVKIAHLERKIGQLTMELDLLKKTSRVRIVSNNESSSIVSGPLTVVTRPQAICWVTIM
ncbi:MAG: transposase [Collimonas sp.]|uniref:transposase n=1 Tax=Collimonas sp. TaxID=1963772 RepID=UPI003266FA21